MKQEFENEFSKLWKKIEGLTPDLQEIYWRHWDETGRPKSDKSEIRAIVDILKKNGSTGFIGFKLDMSSFFEKENFSEKQLEVYYSAFIGGAKFMAERFAKGVEENLANRSATKP